MTSAPSPCPYCRIARRQSPAHIVYEDDYLVAFLDSGPVRAAQVRIIPRDHCPAFDDLTAELASRMVILGQKLVRTLKASKISGRAFLFTVSDSAHAHAHVVPMAEGAEEQLAFPPVSPAKEDDLWRMALTLRQAIGNKAEISRPACNSAAIPP